MSALHVSAATPAQLSAMRELSDPPGRIYMEAWRLLKADGTLMTPAEAGAPDGIPFYAALPYMTRQEPDTRDMADLETVAAQAKEKGYAGLLARNLEQLGYLALTGFSLPVVSDYGLYVWNPEAFSVLRGSDCAGDMLAAYSLPFEPGLSRQIETANGIGKDVPCDICVYGRIPMMVSAPCVKMNTDGCTGARGCLMENVTKLTDRTNRTMPVACVCRYCYNVIYNAYPLSLHRALKRIMRAMPQAFPRVDLTTETAREAAAVVSYFMKCLRADGETEDTLPPYAEYTTGRSGKDVD